MIGNSKVSSSLPEWLVRRTAQALGGHPWSRRSFLTRTAVLGSALTVNPVQFALRPVSAFAAVCGTDASCADGYSAFCCTINNGGNFCPEGSFAGGWWKADDSGFCCGGPRYYVDCNAACGSAWTCGCENSASTCDHRLIACNQFRYGQCHQEIACYGPVVCRVVTCTPPWEFDPACTTSSATDENTVTHTAPCLPGNCPSAIIMRWSDLGGPGSYLGEPVTVEGPAPAGGGTWVQFQHGAMYNVVPAGLHYVHGFIWLHYAGMGGPRSLLGYPITDDTGTPDGIGRYNHFAGDGAIYWTPQLGAWSIHGALWTKWSALGWEAGVLGYPVTDVMATPDGLGRFNHFVKLNGAGQRVDAGAIYATVQLGVWSIHGPIWTKWSALGWEAGVLGYPTSDVQAVAGGGSVSQFAKLNSAGAVVQRGAIYSAPATGTWYTYGGLLTAYVAAGGPTGSLGFPIGDPLKTTESGQSVVVQHFQHGTLTWNPATGRVT